MNKVVRWNPVRDLLSMRNEMDRVMESFFSQSPTGEGMTSWGIALDVIENNGGYEVIASIPGLKPDDLDVTINDGILTIKGETRSEHEEESEEGAAVHYHLRERRYGRFSRSLRLPNDVDYDGVTAHHEDGILTLTLPKSEVAKPRKIEVK